MNPKILDKVTRLYGKAVSALLLICALRGIWDIVVLGWNALGYGIFAGFCLALSWFVWFERSWARRTVAILLLLFDFLVPLSLIFEAGDVANSGGRSLSIRAYQAWLVLLDVLLVPAAYFLDRPLVRAPE